MIDPFSNFNCLSPVLHRASSDLHRLEPFAPRFVVAPLDDAEALAAVMPEGLDAVFHVAGDVSFWGPLKVQQDRTNIDGTRAVCAAAQP